MSIDAKANYISKVEVLGICPKGTKLKVWTVKDNDNVHQPKIGATGRYGFNLPNGGGVFLAESDVELDTSASMP